MNKYNLGVVFYGYHGVNRVLEGTPNPSINVKLNGDTEQIFTRWPCDSVIGIDLRLNQQKFDETFNYLEFNEYLRRCKDLKIIPFSGFYFDVNNCWDYFDVCKNSQPKITDKSKVENDRKYVSDNKEKMTLVMDNDCNKILDYIISINEGAKSNGN